MPMHDILSFLRLLTRYMGLRRYAEQSKQLYGYFDKTLFVFYSTFMSVFRESIARLAHV